MKLKEKGESGLNQTHRGLISVIHTATGVIFAHTSVRIIIFRIEPSIWTPFF